MFGFISGTGAREIGIWKDYDSRAMRKVEDGQDIAVVVEASGISLGVSVVNVSRMLIKLH